MDLKTQAIKEAVNFIKQNWIGKSGIWQGEVFEFVGAVVQGPVTHIDIRNLVNAINDGEPTPIEDMGGTIKNGKLVNVWVSKCTH